MVKVACLCTLECLREVTDRVSMSSKGLGTSDGRNKDQYIADGKVGFGQLGLATRLGLSGECERGKREQI